jgi:hypothetical protein
MTSWHHPRVPGVRLRAVGEVVDGFHLGFGRIVVSEIEAPNMLVIVVRRG